MKRRISSIFAAVAVLLTMVTVMPVGAASDSSSGLSIAPRKDYVIYPGKSVTDKLRIANLNPKLPLYLNMKAVDFTYADESGTPKLNLTPNASPTTWSLRPFISLPPNVTIPPGGSASVSYTIKVPANQGAGSYYSAILYASGASNGSNVNLNASGTTLVFVSVPGTVSEDLTLKKLGAYQTGEGGVGGKYVYVATTHPPANIAYTLQNNSNVAEAPTGSITVKSSWFALGRKDWTIDNINPHNSLALIGQTRLFLACLESQEQDVTLGDSTTKSTTCVTPHFVPGYYRIHMDAFYGQNGNPTKEIIASAGFWYLPWWFLGLLLAVILVAAYLIRKIVRKIRGIGKPSNASSVKFRGR